MIGSRAIAGAWSGVTAPPSYPATAADRRTVQIAGLELPVWSRWCCCGSSGRSGWWWLPFRSSSPTWASKPELELFSTLGEARVYGWLAWRTGSIVWGSIGHVYNLTLVTVAASAS